MERFHLPMLLYAISTKPKHSEESYRRPMAD